MGQEAKLKEAANTKLLAEYDKMSKDLNRFADFSICKTRIVITCK